MNLYGFGWLVGGGVAPEIIAKSMHVNIAVAVGMNTICIACPTGSNPRALESCARADTMS